MDGQDDVRMFCGGCGLVFGLDDIDDMDDVQCPDCQSRDVDGLGDD
jgi:DNA-directed RNA polymerase subunit RPC12/RpoP